MQGSHVPSQPTPNLAVRHLLGTLAGSALTDGARVRDVAERYGTPLFVYDAVVLERTWLALRQALPESIDIYYSIKANPTQTLLRYFLAKGSGLEVASAGEIHQALAAGCDPSRIVFAGPGKTDAELEVALTAGIGEIHVESIAEAMRLAAAAQRHNAVAPVALRVNPVATAQGGAMRMGGREAPFGVDEEDLDSTVHALLAERALHLAGVHIFAGTQILDVDVLLNQYRKALDIARRVADRCDRPLRTLDFGGGLGIPYFERDRPLDLPALARGTRELMEQISDDPRLEGTRCLVEPGRFLVGPCGLYVTRVVDIKESRGKRFLVVDGGMHQHLAASGNLGQTIKRNHPVVLLERLAEAPAESVDVVGPLCTPLDVLARSIDLPRARVGDLVGILQSGAYARSASPLGFLSHPSPPEVWVTRDEDRLIRRRGLPADSLVDQIAYSEPVGV